MKLLVQLPLTRHDMVVEQSLDNQSLPASATSQIPKVKDALAIQCTQAEPASTDELKAALVQVHVASVSLFSRFAVAYLSLRGTEGRCRLTRLFWSTLRQRASSVDITHTEVVYDLSCEMLKRATVQVQRENRQLEAQLETMREQHHLVAQLLAARLKQHDEIDLKGTQAT